MITNVEFVSIPTNEQDRALKFWAEVVGFELLGPKLQRRAGVR